MALPPALKTLYDILQGLNGDPWNPTSNPLGLARGGNQAPANNFIKAMKTVADYGKGIADLVSSTSADAIAAAQSAAAAAQAEDGAEAARDKAQLWADAPENQQVEPGLYSALHWMRKALGYSNQAKDSSDLASSYAAGLNLPAIGVSNALQFLQVKQDGSGYRTVEIPPTPAILPITMTAPASGATDVGAGGTYTFVARAFAGDTTGFYSNYGVPVASRFVNVYEPGGTNPVKTFTAAGGGPSLVANFTGSGLVVSHAYQFEFGYTDAQGNTVKSPKVSATTASQFKPTVGQAYQGGFLGFQNFGDGDLFDLVVAPKSTEASRQWNAGGTTAFNTLSRLNGPANTFKITSEGGGNTGSSAQMYAASISIGGVAGYLGAIDELRAIASKLNPNVAVEAAFKTGGAEVFDSSLSWTSTEYNAGNSTTVTMATGGEDVRSKGTSLSVRAIKRVSTIAPYPIGTAMEGGYLAAYFTDLSSGSPVTYMLIVADKATEVTRAWDTGTTAMLGYTSRTSGAQYTTEAARYAAFAYANGLVSGGKTDWYLGAIDEMLAIMRMGSQLPSGQQLPAPGQEMWTSTELDASNAKTVYFGSNASSSSEASRSKPSSVFVRPIRRVLLPAT